MCVTSQNQNKQHFWFPFFPFTGKFSISRERAREQMGDLDGPKQFSRRLTLNLKTLKK